MHLRGTTVLAQGVISWDSPLKTSFAVDKPKTVQQNYIEDEGGEGGGGSRRSSQVALGQVVCFSDHLNLRALAENHSFSHPFDHWGNRARAWKSLLFASVRPLGKSRQSLEITPFRGCMLTSSRRCHQAQAGKRATTAGKGRSGHTPESFAASRSRLPAHRHP